MLRPFDDFVACRRRVLRLDTGFGRAQRDIERQNAGVLGVIGCAKLAVLRRAGERQHGFGGVPAIGAAFERARERAVRRVQRIAAGHGLPVVVILLVELCRVARAACGELFIAQQVVRAVYVILYVAIKIRPAKLICGHVGFVRGNDAFAHRGKGIVLQNLQIFAEQSAECAVRPVDVQPRAVRQRLEIGVVRFVHRQNLRHGRALQIQVAAVRAA